MSMNTYPLTDTGFVISAEIAAYMIHCLNLAEENQADKVKQMSEEEFLQKAANYELPDDYFDIAALHETLSDKIEAVYCIGFEGSTASAFPADKTVQETYEDDILLYIPLNQTPEFCRAVYASVDEIVNEIKTKLDTINITLPEHIDIRSRIMTITGTYFC